MTLVKITVALVLIFSVDTLIDAKSKSKPVAASDENSVEPETDAHGFVKDPFVFYKWPGFAQSEGVYGHWPWYPAFVVEVPKKKKDSEEDDLGSEEDEEEDDEPQDDFHKHKHHKKHEDEHYHHHQHTWKRQKPTAVYSVGFGPAEGKETWYGVLRPKVRMDLDLDLNEENEDTEEDSSAESSSSERVVQRRGYFPRPRQFLQRRKYYVPYPYMH